MFYTTPQPITNPVSNNAFSYEERKLLLGRKPEIIVPEAKRGSWRDVTLGETVVFEELDDGVLHSCTGLRDFIYSEGEKCKPSYAIFDNHNHAFYFWMRAYHEGKLPWGVPVVHVDQHKDMRKPDKGISQEECADMNNVLLYTNSILNVGNFIQPALQNGFLSEVIMVDSSSGLEEALPDTPFILDVDLDIFHKDLEYLDFDKVLNFIHSAMARASFVTIATSPYFLSGEEAMEWMGRVFVSIRQ